MTGSHGSFDFAGAVCRQCDGRCRQSERIDLAASSARVASAKITATFQARIVESFDGHADKLNIDLQFLTQENVLVLEDTHRLLVALAAREGVAADFPSIDDTARIIRSRKSRMTKIRRPLVLALQILALAILSSVIIEIADPAPVEVLAIGALLHQTGP